MTKVVMQYLFFLVMVMNVTQAFTFVAALCGLSVASISLVLVALNGIYLILERKCFRQLLGNLALLRWALALLVWPLCTIVYAPVVAFREIGLAGYLFLLFLGTAVYMAANGLKAVRRVVTTSLLVTLVGLAMSMAWPELFAKTALLANGKAYHYGRAFGFFLQPNMLSICLCFLFIAWFSQAKFRRVTTEVVVLLLFLFAVVLTGSRVGILAAVLIVAAILANSWKRQSKRRFFSKVGLLAVCLAAGSLGLQVYVSSRKDDSKRGKHDFAERLSMMASFELTEADSVTDDISVQARFQAQALYWKLFCESPLFGHGLGADSFFKGSGRLQMSAHNSLLFCALEYGILYIFFLLFLLGHIFLQGGRRNVACQFETNALTQFGVVSLVLFYISSVLQMRFFYFFLGIYVVAAHCRRQADCRETAAPSRERFGPAEKRKLQAECEQDR